MVADDPIAPRVSRPVAPASDLTGANGINTPFMDLRPAMPVMRTTMNFLPWRSTTWP